LRGVLSIDKPTGITSYDVIRRLKAVLRPAPRAIGHAGTLDPMASGVLLVLLGEATKVSSLLLGRPKTYAATVLFGRATDTDDNTGRVVRESALPAVDRAGLDTALDRFRGAFEQVPPAYSAIKQDGRPLYEKARRGEAVTVRPRTVTVYELSLNDWTPPRATLELTVSAGTYIRSIARDIGESLGSAATLEKLVRTRIGRFALKGSLPGDNLTDEAARAALIPVEDALDWLPRVEVSPEQARDLLLGRRIPLPAIRHSELDIRHSTFDIGHSPLLCSSPDRRFLALARAEGDKLQPDRIVYNDD
jgi:tRNA pseudouridine55 synthase